MTDTDTAAYVHEQQTIEDFSDSELLAFWQVTETAQVDGDEVDERETALIAFAAQELVKRGLLLPA